MIRAAAAGLTTVVVLLMTTAAVAETTAPSTLSLTLTAERTGWITVRITGPPTAAIALSDVTGTRRRLGTWSSDPSGTLNVARAARWNCVRERRIEATYVDAAGSQQVAEATVTTPSCNHRLALRASPSLPRAGGLISLQVTDRWRVGDLETSVCFTSGFAGRSCKTLSLKPGTTQSTLSLRTLRAGRHRINVRYGGRQETTTVLVRPRTGKLRLLAAGDSMMQILDENLRKRIAARGPVRLTSDAHISTGITKPFLMDWVAHAAATARSIKPDVTAVFLGANDGYPIGDDQCCDERWQAGYAKRAARMMRSYSRGERANVYWLLLPTPRKQALVHIYGQVNQAVRQASAEFPEVVKIVDLNQVFTPGGRFRQSMMWHGQRVSVRQDDGVHLSTAGTRIAAEVIEGRMRDDGLVR